jgi:hypothetical protein
MKIRLVVISLFLNGFAFSQAREQNPCYQNTIDNAEVFTKALHYPYYKGGERELNLFLANEIDIQFISTFIPDSLIVFEDSVQIKFVISRRGTMSDLSASGDNAALCAEIRKALIKSACNWVPGGTERHLPVWYNGTIYFRLDKRPKACSLTVSSLSNNL